MGLKILHSADWHLDSPFASFPEEQRVFLKQAQQKIPEKIGKLCRENHCDLLLLAGDLFDGPWSRDTLDRVQKALAACGCPVMIAPGNHDPWGPGCPWLEKWPENVHIFAQKLESVLLKDLNCRVYGAGFSSMDSESLLKDFYAEEEDVFKVGVFHGDPTNVNSCYNPVTSGQIRQSGLDYLALGHVHSLGGLEVENTVCGWPGCPMGRGWDELGPKGCLLVSIDETVQVSPCALDLPAFYVEKAEMKDGGLDLEEILPPAGSQDFYRITLEGYGSPNLSELYRKYSAFPNLELRDHTVDPNKLWEDAGEDSLRGSFFALLRETAENGDEKQQKTAFLAAEISKKLLEGREVQLP